MQLEADKDLTQLTRAELQRAFAISNEHNMALKVSCIHDYALTSRTIASYDNA